MASLFARLRNMLAVQKLASPTSRNPEEKSERGLESLAIALAAERQLQRKREAMLREASDWERRAAHLRSKGDENLARNALERAASLRSAVAAQDALAIRGLDA